MRPVLLKLSGEVLKGDGEGTFDFNPTTRVITWDIGDVGARTNAVGSFQISFRPSASQIEKVPVLIGEQRLRTDDDFTGSVVRTNSLELTTRLRAEDGHDEESGTVKSR